MHVSPYFKVREFSHPYFLSAHTDLDSIVNGTFNTKKMVISVPIKDFIHDHHRELFYDITGLGLGAVFVYTRVDFEQN